MVPAVVVPAAKVPTTVVPAPPSSSSIADLVIFHYHLYLCLISCNMSESISIVPGARPMVVAMAMATATIEVPPTTEVLVSAPTLLSPVGL